MIVIRSALSILVALAALFLVPARTFASPDQIDVMATVHQFVDGFNTGNTQSALAACASPASIIDDFPPHEWQGPGACAEWAAAFAATSKREGITGGIVTLGKPWHIDITEKRAYVVVPVTYKYKQRGKQVVELNSIFTVALHRLAIGWRITGWAWSRR